MSDAVFDVWGGRIEVDAEEIAVKYVDVNDMNSRIKRVVSFV